MRILVCLGSAIALAASATAPEGSEVQIDPLERLKLGNQRYQSGKAAHFDQDDERRLDLVHGQHPYAVLVGCTDSRVPPEVVFDQGLGDLFVVRTAGEALDDLSLASIEYAVEHLGVRTIVVLGHEGCGLVSAALRGDDPAGHQAYLLRAMQPRVAGARRLVPLAAAGERAPAIPPEVLDAAVVENVRAVVAELEDCGPILSELQHTGELRVVGARYDLDTGAVDWLPAQAREHARR